MRRTVPASAGIEARSRPLRGVRPIESGGDCLKEIRPVSKREWTPALRSGPPWRDEKRCGVYAHHGRIWKRPVQLLIGADVRKRTQHRSRLASSARHAQAWRVLAGLVVPGE